MRGTVARRLRKQHLLVDKDNYMYTTDVVKKVKTFSLGPTGELEEIILSKTIIVNTTKLAYNLAKKLYKRK